MDRPPLSHCLEWPTIFLFISLETASGATILQPVLQYGPSAAGGGAYWSIATWYITSTTVYYNTIYSVAPGQIVIGLIDFIITSNGAYKYIAEFDNIAASGSLSVTSPAVLTKATESLAAYGITSINNYPSTSTIFSSISLTTTNGVPGIYWNAVSNTLDGITTTVTTQGATNAKITITY